MSTPSVLSVLLESCDAESDLAHGQPSLAMVVLTMMPGLIFVLAWKFRNRSWRETAPPPEPDAKPEVAAATTDVDMVEVASGLDVKKTNAETAEMCVEWLMERCQRSTRQAENSECRILYEQRLALLHGLSAAMRSNHRAYRRSTLMSLGNMSDMSDDERSPNYARCIRAPASLGDAQVL